MFGRISSRSTSTVVAPAASADAMYSLVVMGSVTARTIRAAAGDRSTPTTTVRTTEDRGSTLAITRTTRSDGVARSRSTDCMMMRPVRPPT
jgi:hypothetical protein